jgi:nondiscriminating aspartyl-tRNA synthetase
LSSDDRQLNDTSETAGSAGVPVVKSAEARSHVGERVRLQGWVHRIRALGKISFIILRDRMGLIQTVADAKQDVSQLTHESVVEIQGTIVEAKKVDLGVELHVEEIKVISASPSELPIEINKPLEISHTGLDRVLDYRPLSLRNLKVRAIFKVQAEILWAFSHFMRSKGFTEIKTSKIVSTGTEGGAEVFEVKYFERSAYLAQSPQFYKQIMVGSGLERVFEIGQVYRAEKHETSRHLNEYTSLDYEMGFIESEQDVIRMEEELLSFVFGHLSEACSEELKIYEAKVPVFDGIPQFTLAEACAILKDKYGKDLEGAGDLDNEGEGLVCRHAAETQGVPMAFITQYPAGKRPVYTMPRADDPSLTTSFDLLFDGLEVTTGSQRIHDYDMLVGNMRNFGLNPDDFGFYLQTFRYGMPPHGGLAIGLERLTKQVLGLDNVKEATLFPRSVRRISP